jgi:hypothetical protein
LYISGISIEQVIQKARAGCELSKGDVVNSPLHFSAKGRTTATVYRKGGAFFDFHFLVRWIFVGIPTYQWLGKCKE